MLYFIEGRVLHKGNNFIILSNNGLGWQIFVGDLFLAKTKINEIVKVFVQLYIYEEQAQLYGFASEEELIFFKKLNNIPNIGPKSAMNILSAIKLSDLKRAILNEDMDALNKVSGIGKKTAERIIVEMKDKIKDVQDISATSDDGQVIDALIKLGYSLKEARQVLKKIPDEIVGANNKLKTALKLIGK